MELQAKVYVGTYEKYNNGSLDGAWIDLTEHDRESFFEECQELHGEGEHEFMFQDWECSIEGAISECCISDDLWKIIEADLDETQLAVVTAYAENNGGMIDVSQSDNGRLLSCDTTMLSAMSEAYWNSLCDEDVEKINSLPDFVVVCHSSSIDRFINRNHEQTIVTFEHDGLNYVVELYN
jgi:antirestriction protein